MNRTLLVAALLICVPVILVCEMAESQQEQVKPKKVEVDSNYDGVVDRIEFYDNNGQIVKIEFDRTGDGKTDEWVTYKNGQPSNVERDTNADGKPDVWVEY